MIIKESVSVLLPTRGRYSPVLASLSSLSKTINAGDLEVIIVADNDDISYEIANQFKSQSVFRKYKVISSNERLYSVGVFNLALQNCDSNLFVWTNDEISYENFWLNKVLKKFIETFPDKIGVLAIGGKLNKANFGMTSKRFISINKGEWFWNGYKTSFCDDELACRAILLGRYVMLRDSGFINNPKITDKYLLYNNYEEKIAFKKVDRAKFYERTAVNFGFKSEEIYEWKGFREINEPLKI